MKKLVNTISIFCHFMLQSQNTFSFVGTLTPSGKVHVIGQTFVEQGHINFLTTYSDRGGNIGIKLIYKG